MLLFCQVFFPSYVVILYDGSAEPKDLWQNLVCNEMK